MVCGRSLLTPNAHETNGNVKQNQDPPYGALNLLKEPKHALITNITTLVVNKIDGQPPLLVDMQNLLLFGLMWPKLHPFTMVGVLKLQKKKIKGKEYM
jgi:hypothetical protein